MAAGKPVSESYSRASPVACKERPFGERYALPWLRYETLVGRWAEVCPSCRGHIDPCRNYGSSEVDSGSLAQEAQPGTHAAHFGAGQKHLGTSCVAFVRRQPGCHAAIGFDGRTRRSPSRTHCAAGQDRSRIQRCFFNHLDDSFHFPALLAERICRLDFAFDFLRVFALLHFFPRHVSGRCAANRRHRRHNIGLCLQPGFLLHSVWYFGNSAPDHPLLRDKDSSQTMRGGSSGRTGRRGSIRTGRRFILSHAVNRHAQVSVAQDGSGLTWRVCRRRREASGTEGSRTLCRRSKFAHC